MSGRLAGRRAIVTGAAFGIGQTSAALFASEGGTSSRSICPARAWLFLASDEGRFVTGHGLAADGGLMLRC